MFTTGQLIKILSIYVSNVNITIIFIFVAHSIFDYLQRKRELHLFKFDNYIIRLVTRCSQPVYLLYKISLIFLLHMNFLLSIPLLINYFFNLLAVRNLSKGRNEQAELNQMSLNPFNQYKAMYFLSRENKEDANHSYRYFSLGFWMLLPFFLFGGIGISQLFCVVMVLLWPSLIILQLIYAKQENYSMSKIKHYSPLFIQLLSVNLLGSIILYIISRKGNRIQI